MTTEVHDDRSTEPSSGSASRTATTADGPTPPATPRRRPGTVGAKPGAARAAAQAARPRAGIAERSDEGPTAERSVVRTELRVGGAEPPAPGGSRRGRLPWILAVLGLVGTVAFAGAWLSARGDAGSGHTTSSTAQSGDAKAVKAAAQKFSLALTNFDGATIDRDFDRLLGLSTGAFKDQADQFFSSKTRKALKEAQASSRGEIRSVYVQAVDGNQASAFVVVDQTIANNKSPQPQADTLRMEVTVKFVDGTWQVNRVNVLQAPADGTGLDPSGGTGTATGGGSGN